MRFFSLLSEQERASVIAEERNSLIETVAAAQEQIKADRVLLERAYQGPLFVDPSTAAP